MKTIASTHLPSFFFLLQLIVALATVHFVRGANGQLDGQVVHNATGLPIVNAMLELNLEPPDGIPEYSVRSDPFGFFKFPDVTAGAYTFTARQLGFLNHEESVTIVDDDRKKAVVRLTPADATVTFEIFFQIWCLSTHARLSGASVTAEYWEPDGVLTGGADNAFVMPVDDAGTVVFPGMKDGFYKFSISKTGWEPITYTPPPGSGFVTDGDRVRLATSHFGSVFMKPIKTPLTVTVTGYDPVEDEAGVALEGMVINLTGVDANDGSVLLPTRTGLTSEVGDFRFGSMPPVSYRVVVGRLGYVTKEVEVSPKADGTFDPVEVAVELEPTKVRAVLSSPYQTSDAVNNATVRLRGIRSSNTEGIERELVTQADAGMFTASALFENLLPGRYWIHVAHAASISGFPSSSGNIPGPSFFSVKFFPRELYGEVVVSTTEEVKVDLSPVPAVVRGRLFATDELAKLNEEPFDPEPNRVWRQAQQNGVTFIEHEVVNLLTNTINQVVVDTDESGGYTALVYPGVYGVQIPGMDTYTGHNIEFGDLSQGQGPIPGPWPYPNAWPYNNREFGHHGAGLQLDSDHEYQLDLFVHAHYMNLCGFVQPQNDPFGQLILRMNTDGSGVVGVDYDHLLDTGAMVTYSGPVSGSVPVGEGNQFLIPNMTPGQYTITMNHPDYTTTPLVVTVGPWQAPGVLPIVEPVVDPTYFFPGITHCWGGSGQFELSADWNTLGTIRVKRYVFNAGEAEYNSAGESNPDYFRMTGLTDRLFSFANGSGIPNGAYTIWEKHGDGWFTGAASGTFTFDGALEGGPFDNTPPNEPPSGATTYSLDLRAVSQSDPTMTIPGVTVQFPSGSPRMAGGIVAHDGSPYPSGATQDTGQWLYSFFPSPVVEVVDPATRLIKTTVFMRRAMVVSGTVTAQSDPIPSAAVVIRNRYGNPIGRATTDADGNYNVGFLTPQPVFVDVNKRGFVPQRTKFTPPSVANPDIAANFAMAVVPPPTIDTFTMNRFGLFLPGASKAADASGFNPDAPRPKLTMTWKTEARGANYNVSLDGFFNGNETQKPPEVSQVIDAVEEIWLVDRRSFTNAFVNEPDQTNFNQLDPPDPLNYITVIRWLNEITNAQKDGKPLYAVHQLRMRGRDGQVGNKFEGKIYVPELPSGAFKPRLIAITKSGGVAVKDYELPNGRKSLQGMNLPPWAATFLNLVGAGANFGSFNASTLQGLPGGGFLKIGEKSPVVEARIGLLPSDAEIEDDAALSYKYVLGMDLPVGEETAATGPLGFGPKFLGLRIQGASAEFEVNGEDKEAALAIVVPASEPGDNDELDENYKPAITPARSLVEPLANDFDYSVKVAAALGIDEDPLGGNIIDRFSVILEVQGLYSGGVRFNATPVLRFIPYAGPVLETADKTRVLTFYLRIETALGAKIAGKIETTFTKPLGATRPAGADPLPERPSFLGIEKIDPSIEAKLIARLAGGLDASAFNGRVEASGLFQLGAPTGVSDTDGIFFTLNTSTNKTPLITKIEGAFSFVARVKVKLWTVGWNKSWQWDFNRWVIDRASEPSFELVPLDIVFTEIKPSAAPKETFVGDAETVVQDFLGTGSYSLAQGGDPLLVYTGVDPDTGEMTVMASVPSSSGQWQMPVEVARAAGVVSVVTHELPTGGWLLAWSELGAADVLNPYPTTAIRYSTSNPAGTVWSVPIELVSADEAMFDLKLTSKNPDLLLTWLGTADGPFGSRQTLKSSAFNGTTWSTPEAVLTDTHVTDYDVAGNDAGAAVAVVTTGSSELIYSVSSSPWTTPLVITNTAGGGPVSVAFDGTNDLAAVWQNLDGSTEFSSYDLAADTWTHTGVVVPQTLTDELEILPLVDAGQTVHLIAWVEGGDAGALHYTFLDPAGSAVMERRRVNLDETGTYRQIQLRPLTGLRGGIMTQLENAGGGVLREYHVGLPTAGDCDGDGVSDADEINQGSAVDLDSNGIPDGCEIAEGLLADRDRNGIADLYEAAQPGDCNRNGIQDAEEIFLGIVTDDNSNGIPDECERVTQIVPIDRGNPKRYYRATRVIIKSITVDDIEVEFEGSLQRSDAVTGPWVDE